MCQGVPVQIEGLLEDGRARVTLDGVTRPVSLAMIAGAMPGDHVLVHAGIAWERLDPDEAAEMRAALALSAALSGP